MSKKAGFQPTFSDTFHRLFLKSEIYEEGPNSRFRRFDAKNNYVGYYKHYAQLVSLHVDTLRRYVSHR